MNKTFKQITEEVFTNSSFFIEETIEHMDRDNKWIIKMMYPFGLCLQIMEYNQTLDLISFTWFEKKFSFSKG